MQSLTRVLCAFGIVPCRLYLEGTDSLLCIISINGATSLFSFTNVRQNSLGANFVNLSRAKLWLD